MSSARLRTGPSWPRREQYAVCTVAPVQRAGGNRRASSVAVWTSLGTSGVLEALTVSEIENKAAWAISPWKADPYHTAVYLAQFAVPVLALLIVLRLLTRGALTGPGAAGRPRGGGDGGADRADAGLRRGGGHRWCESFALGRLDLVAGRRARRGLRARRGGRGAACRAAGGRAARPPDGGTTGSAASSSR